ncbi:FYVE and coiled-coil domain-containing protein 1 isoform X2 [Hemicordylus capensis]|uniref:FYVE and coiled-coil domain-containing protein 1 isoform X2 n=1 Tax=Hemicordylus capensis TaxID=884348 RepID=UPI0023021AEE|nr:FYVE and coiled-coil domain-containing protein 1 isoform X2 [Hemicordylus capensis]
MAASSGESQLQRIIRDLQDAVTELNKEFTEAGEPITDDCISLHKFSYKLEYLLQFDQKEKSTLLRTRKDYWDYFCDCLAKVKGANDGIRFVKSISELRTSLGKGRAFIRYSLMHQRLADTLQQCFMNTKVTSDWYYARSPFLNPKMSSDIVGHLYELTEVQFDLASRGYDLDSAWPTFARRTLSSLGSQSYLWKPPSRSSSMSSLVSSYLQAQDIPSSPDGNSFINSEPLESLDELHVDLDQAQLKQKELQDRIQHLEKENHELQEAFSLEKQQAQVEREKSSNIGEENVRLMKMLGELEKQWEISHCTQDTVQDLQKCLQTLELNAVEKQKVYSAKLEELESSKKDAESKLLLLNQELETTRTSVDMKDLCISELTARLKSAEQKNEELVVKVGALMNEKGQKASIQYDSALKIEELLQKLHEAEQDKTDIQQLNNRHISQLRLVEEQLRLKEETQKEFESRLRNLADDSKEESGKLRVNLEIMSTEKTALQKELTAKGKEMADLQIQLKTSLDSIKSLEIKLEEERKERERLEEEFSYGKTTKEQEVQNLREQLELLENNLSKLSQNIKSLKEQKKKLISDKEHLSKTIESMKEEATQQSSLLRNERKENEKLTCQIEKLQQTNQKLEEKLRALYASTLSLEAEVAKLRASEKQLQSQIDDAVVSVDEKEKKLRGQNKLLDENLQNATRQNQVLEEKLNALQSDHQELKQREQAIQESLNVLQTQHQNTKEHGLQMEKTLSSSKQCEESLKLQLAEKDEALQGLETQCKQLQGHVERYRRKAEDLEAERANVEKTCLHQTKVIESLTSEKSAVEKAQLEQAVCQEREARDLASRLALSEEQLHVSQAEVSRLQEKIMDLQARLQQTAVEKEKLQGKLDVEETVLSEQKDLAQHLKEQSERLNRNHVEELLQCKEREEMLKDERDKEAHQKAELEKNFLCLTDELSKVKQYLETLNMENVEIKDLLHKTNTDMAEFGIQICTLTSEKAEAEDKLSQIMEKLRTTEETAAKKQEKLQLDLSRLSQENQGLQEKLEESKVCAAVVPSLQTQLELAERQAQSLQETSKEELSAVKFQLSTEIINYQTKFKAISEECEKLKQQVEEQNRQADAAEEEFKEMQAVKRDLCTKLDLAMDQVTESKSALQKKEEEVAQLKKELTRAQKEVNKANEQIQDYCEKLSKMRTDQDSNEQKLLAELDDLTKTKQFLEERLIELLRDKDALWQKSDALEFQQKLTAEQRWLGDAEVNCCLECKREFGWMSRRHHCRMCGRIFCYYCCNNYIMSKHTGKKERCCRNCFQKLSVSSADSGSNTSQEESSGLLASPLSLVRRVMVTNEAAKPTDDAHFDIITDEEVGQLQEGDSIHNENQTEEESMDHSVTDLTYNSSTFDESDELQMAQDAEICLLKSGELMNKLPLTVEDILKFGEANRELFIKSNTYSIIPITVEETGLTISWMFSSDPKSIKFSVVYQESEETPWDQCKVLIPMTRCNSHNETIRGKVKVRNAGIYILVFDNTFSRFLSKKVFFHLTVQHPVIYDGSDFP